MDNHLSCNACLKFATTPLRTGANIQSAAYRDRFFATKIPKVMITTVCRVYNAPRLSFKACIVSARVTFHCAAPVRSVPGVSKIRFKIGINAPTDPMLKTTVNRLKKDANKSIPAKGRMVFNILRNAFIFLLLAHEGSAYVAMRKFAVLWKALDNSRLPNFFRRRWQPSFKNWPVNISPAHY